MLPEPKAAGGAVKVPPEGGLGGRDANDDQRGAFAGPQQACASGKLLFSVRVSVLRKPAPRAICSRLVPSAVCVIW